MRARSGPQSRTAVGPPAARRRSWHGLDQHLGLRARDRTAPARPRARDAMNTTSPRRCCSGAPARGALQPTSTTRGRLLASCVRWRGSGPRARQPERVKEEPLGLRAVVRPRGQELAVVLRRSRRRPGAARRGRSARPAVRTSAPITAPRAARPARVEEPVDDLVEIAFHDVGQLVEREPDAVVGHAVLREVVGADLARCGRRCRPSLRRSAAASRPARCALELEQARAQHLQRLALFLSCERSSWHATTMPGRNVRDAHGASRSC